MPKPAKTLMEHFRELPFSKKLIELYDIRKCMVNIDNPSALTKAYSHVIKKYRNFDHRRIDKINKQPELLVVMEKGEDSIADEATYTVYYRGHTNGFFSFDLAGKYIKLNHE